MRPCAREGPDWARPPHRHLWRLQLCGPRSAAEPAQRRARRRRRRWSAAARPRQRRLPSPAPSLDLPWQWRLRRRWLRRSPRSALRRRRGSARPARREQMRVKTAPKGGNTPPRDVLARTIQASSVRATNATSAPACSCVAVLRAGAATGGAAAGAAVVACFALGAAPAGAPSAEDALPLRERCGGVAAAATAAGGGAGSCVPVAATARAFVDRAGAAPRGVTAAVSSFLTDSPPAPALLRGARLAGAGIAAAGEVGGAGLRVAAPCLPSAGGAACVGTRRRQSAYTTASVCAGPTLRRGACAVRTTCF